MADIITDLKKYVKEDKLVLGTDKTLKLLKTGGVAQLFRASNCPEDLKSDVDHYAKLASVEVVDVPLSNEELGTICKKPFSIVLMGLLKE